MASYVITRDCINDTPSNVPIEQVIPETELIIQKYPKRFKLLDDDEIVYFYGRMKDTNDMDEFEPLDEIGTSYGCTDIQVWENDEWVSV